MVTVAFLWEKLSQPQVYKYLTRKIDYYSLKFDNSVGELAIYNLHMEQFFEMYNLKNL